METIDMPPLDATPSDIDRSSHPAPTHRSSDDGSDAVGTALRHLEEAGLAFVEVARCPAPRCPACHRSIRRAA